jgi:hypothetical protein
MLNITRSKIQQQEFSSNLPELKKLVRIAAFAVIEKSRNFSPLQPEYIQATDALNNLAEKDLPNSSESFEYTKSEVEKIVNKLVNDLSLRGIQLENPISEILNGKARIALGDEIDFALHMVEQNNLSFFKNRTSHVEVKT